MNSNQKINYICNYLKENNISFKAFHHEAVSSIEECRKIEDLINGEICKNLLLRTTSGSDFYILSMKGNKPFVTKDISKKLGTSRLSFASADEMEKLVCTSPGSLGIMSLIFDSAKKVSYAIDEDLANSEFLCFHAGVNTCTLKIKTEDIFKKLLPLLDIEAEIIEI